jgi:hypothetical protein
MWGNGHLSPLLSEGGIKDTHKGQVPVAHFCNPSYSGGRDQEDLGSVSTWGEIVLETLSRENPSQKRADGLTKGVGPEFKPQYHT